MVKPILMYGCDVWGLYIPGLVKQKDILDRISNDKTTYEKIHLKALKHALGVSKTASNVACLMETGRYPIVIDIITQCIKYVLRLFTLPADSLLGLASIEHILANHNKQSIPFLVFDKICSKSGVTLHDIDKNKLSPHKIHSISHRIKRSLIATFNKHGIDKIKRTPKLEFYSMIKTSSRMEPYLDWVKNPQFRSVLTRYRISDHHFPIESLRCTDLTRFQRLCLSCDINEIGGLLHCIFHCPSTEKIIRCLNSKLAVLSPQVTLLKPEDKLKYILSCNDKDVTLLCLKPLSDIDKSHQEKYDILKPIIVNKLRGNRVSLSARGASSGQYISDLKTITCLFN